MRKSLLGFRLSHLRQALPAGLILLASFAATAADRPVSPTPLEVGSRLELFVDDFLIDSMKGVQLKLHEREARPPIHVRHSTSRGRA